jgi:hypothetical protein
MSSLATGVWLFLGFHAIGLGPALLLRRWTDLPWRYVCLLTLLASSVLSYAAFWMVFIAPATRPAVVGAILLGSLAVLPLAVPRGQFAATVGRPSVWGPSLATALLSAACLWPLLISGPRVNDRFAWQLPSDNILPGLFAHVVLRGSTVRPVPPLWPDGDRASERPPLQAAVVAIVGSTVPGIGGDEYQELATWCQAQWLPALFLVGLACGVRRAVLTIALGACVFSGFFFVNTVYTWPKLFAAALMLGALAIAIEPAAASAPAARARTMAAAALATLSLLAHPGPVFSLLAVPLCWRYVRPLLQLPITRAACAWSVLTAAALCGPWVAYQSLVDPPTGRLMREHLGDGRAAESVLVAVSRANLERPLREHLRVGLANVAGQLGNPLAAVWPDSITEGQAQQFFRHGASLGVLLVGLVLVLAWPTSGDAAADPVRRLAGFALVALILWSVMVFAPGQALIHHGSPVTTSLLFFAGAYGLLNLPRAVAGLLLGAHVLGFFVIWILPMGSGPWQPDGSGTWHAAGFAVLASAAILTLYASHDPSGRDHPAESPLRSARQA